MSSADDIWSEWLKHRRFGGDEAYHVYEAEQLKKLAIKIVDKAQIFETATVLDIGAGDGLIGLTALNKLGNDGKLILSDISQAALAIAKDIFSKKNIQDSRVEFLIAGIEDLSSLQDGTIDRIIMRAVLLYAGNKQAAFKEIYRVLRLGGKAVILEPINQRHIEFEKKYFRGYSLNREPLISVKSLIQKVADKTKRQRPATLIGYNEHDLVQYAVDAGFEEVELEYSFIRTAKAQIPSWKAFFDVAPNPLANTLREEMASVLTSDQSEKVEKALKEAGQTGLVWTNAEALLILKK